MDISSLDKSSISNLNHVEIFKCKSWWKREKRTRSYSFQKAEQTDDRHRRWTSFLLLRLSTICNDISTRMPRHSQRRGRSWHSMERYGCFSGTLLWSLARQKIRNPRRTHNINILAAACNGKEFAVVREAQGVDLISVSHKYK